MEGGETNYSGSAPQTSNITFRTFYTIEYEYMESFNELIILHDGQTIFLVKHADGLVSG